jgi:hypothetical protein
MTGWAGKFGGTGWGAMVGTAGEKVTIAAVSPGATGRPYAVPALRDVAQIVTGCEETILP